jgi:hypothetical protein
MVFELNEIVYLNGEILTNRFPRGDIGVNDIKTIFANNIKGTVYSIEFPSFMNKGLFLYTIKIFENLFGIEIVQNKISKYPIGTDGLIFINDKPVFIETNSFNSNKFVQKNPLGVGFNPINTLEEYNTINKLNFINKQIQIQNTINNNYNLNSDKNVQKTVSKYFYYKIIDEWLYKELFALLAFVEIVDSRPRLIKSIDKYSVEKLASESDENIEKRVGYFESDIITKKIIKQILKKIVKRMCINWYDLDKKENVVRKVFLEYFTNLLEESIKKFNQ